MTITAKRIRAINSTSGNYRNKGINKDVQMRILNDILLCTSKLALKWLPFFIVEGNAINQSKSTDDRQLVSDRPNRRATLVSGYRPATKTKGNAPGPVRATVGRS